MNPHPYPRCTWRGVARGLVAAAVLLLTAVDALAAAVLGVPPTAWTARRALAAARRAYLVGRYGPPSTNTDLEPLVYEGELLDDQEDGRG